jgi:hypothetical protein
LREFRSTSEPLCSPLFTPHLLLSIINTETKGFLREIEKADLELKNRAAKEHAHALSLSNNTSKNAGSTITSPGKCVACSANNSRNASQRNNSEKNFPESVFENSVSDPVYSVHTDLNEEKIENSKETAQKNSMDVELESEEIVEQLPVAELILASHASLLLYTICTCLPVLTESDVCTEHTMSPQLNHLVDDGNGKSVKNSGSESNTKPKINETNVKGRGSNSSDVAVAVTRTHVRTALPKGTWWLPIRVLKGFLVLQGQVRTVTVRTIRALHVVLTLFTLLCQES